MRAALVTVVLAASLAPGAARAGGDSGQYVSDPADPDAEPVYIAELRDPVRFAIGFDVGVGVIGETCRGCPHDLGGLSLDVFAGAQVARRLALLGELWSVLHLLPADSADDRGLVTHTFATAAVRVWLTPELWLQGGLGGAAFRVDASRDDQSDLAPAFTFAIGGELDHHPTRTITVEARLGMAAFDDGGGNTAAVYNIAATAGWHWF